MRRLGVIGGVTWHSSHTLYRLLNEGVAGALGPYRSADLVMRSLDYGLVRECRADGGWKRLGAVVEAAALDCKRAGAEALVLGSNSLHALVNRVESGTGLPVLHIGDALAAEAKRRDLHRLAFFGTGFTMNSPFMRERLEAAALTVLLPENRDELDRIIMEELALGVVNDRSRAFYLEQLAGMPDAEAFVSGCTEIASLVGPEDVSLPHLDTLDLHAQYAVDWIVGAR